jgi:hypothetical protein
MNEVLAFSPTRHATGVDQLLGIRKPRMQLSQQLVPEGERAMKVRVILKVEPELSE